MKILVIDDDESVASAVQRSLVGHDVAVERNSTHVVALVENANLERTPVDVVLCDLTMPGMSGLELLAALRSHPQPPILILISGYDNVVDAALVADGVLLKPFTASELLETIERIKDLRSRTTTRRMPRCAACGDRRRLA